ncbi:metallophosphoesterase [Methanobacterium petrolearium]|uniref:metallophosphoesterase n=1 Tax=Methanobacterium petrolearium TaxID=710190 RepID=UPI001AE9A08C|nr:metallophosphoesterase [Methanobacterium petrolearium]MBP1947074.1 putative MPP superfamily phosphohydrolase [Methanobacterium petrolearium]
MRTIIHYLMFVSLFFVGFLVLNYYVFFGMSFLLGFPMDNGFYILMLIAALSYPVSNIIERTVSNNITRIFYTVASAWMGISFYLLFFLITYLVLSFFITLPRETAGITIAILTIIISSYAIYNSYLLKIKEIEIPLKGLKDDLRVVHLSDIHIGSVRNSGYMERIVTKTNKLNPDVVFITGDMVDGSARLHKHTFKAINRFNTPVFFVTGNHETYEGLDEVFRVLGSTKLKILQNELVEFKGIQVIGVEYSFGRGHLKKILSQLKIDEDKPSILLYHLPGELEDANEAGIDLQLSGHTHNGQMIPFNVLVKLMFPYMTGLYEYKGTKLYVSQGTGTWGPPMRLGSRCEITLITLKS